MQSSPATQRIQALSSHLHASANPEESAKTMATEKKPPITCHVLDTTIGKPAANIPVTLTLHNPSSSSSTPLRFAAQTNGDGRVTSWAPSSPFSAQSLEEVFTQDGDQKYSLTFDTEEYFGTRGIKTFFPEVEVKFVVRGDAKREHYHVPVLLGPFGYTTYRGS
jgi:5-hydroxyisourate hydrolase